MYRRGKLVIRDAHPATPFDGPYTDAYNAGSGATMIQCSDYDDVPSPEPPPVECQ